MKKLVITSALAAALWACNNAADSTADAKDSLDSIASEKKETIDSTAQERMDRIDSTTDMKKATLDSLDSIQRSDSAARKGNKTQ